MHRIILGAAIVAWSWLLAKASVGPPAMAWAAALATLLAHVGTWAILALAERRALRLARIGGWPDWMAAQAEKNRRKALAYSAWGGAMVVAMASFGGSWRIGLASATFAFHLGAFPAARLLIAAQSRLLRGYEARVAFERSP